MTRTKEPTETSPLLREVSRGGRTDDASTTTTTTSATAVTSTTAATNTEDDTTQLLTDVGAAPVLPVSTEIRDQQPQPQIEPSFQGKTTESPRPRISLILPSVSVGVFLTALDSSITVSSYGAIGSDLHALNLTSWIATSYFLPLTAFQPLYGKLSDIFGRKSCLLFAYIVFGLGTLGCGLATNINWLIGSRVLQGLGGGGMTTVVSILISDLVGLEERGVWQGIINIVYAAGSASGASLGGLLSDVIGWRWAFLCQIPICLVALISVSLLLNVPSSPSPPTSSTKPKNPQNEQAHETPASSSGVKNDDEEANVGRNDSDSATDHNDDDAASPIFEVGAQTAIEKLNRVDFLGAVTMVLAVFSLLLGMDRGSNISWTTPTTYVPLVASLFFFVLFAQVESRVAKEPFAPPRIIFNRSHGMLASYLCYLFSFGAWVAILYYLPLYYQAAQGHTASGAAVRLLPAIVASVAGSLCGGFIMKWSGRYYWLTVVSYAALVLGILGVLIFSGLIQGFTSTWGITIGMVLGAFGNGVGMTSCLISLIANSDPKDQAVATACSYLFRSLGSTMGISLSASVIQLVLRSTLEKTLSRNGHGHGHGHEKDTAREIERGVRESLQYINSLNPELQIIVRDAYGNAVRHGYVLMMALSVGAFLASFFLKEQKLKR